MRVCGAGWRPGKAMGVGLVSVALGWTNAGCTVWDLAARGVPDEEMIETYTLEMQPIADLPAGSAHHGGPQPMPLQTTAGFSGWVHGFSYEVLDGNGNSLPHEILHHVKVMAPDARELLSPLMLRIVGAGSETEPVVLPKQAGYRVEAGDSLLVTAMTHNPTGEDYSDVTIRVMLSYSPEGPWKEPLSVYPFFTHVTEPGEEETYYDIPPGRSERSFDVTPALSGRILGLGGHLHQYGYALRLSDPSDGRTLWEVQAERDESGNVIRVPSDIFVLQGGIEVEAGRPLRVTAIYDNPSGQVVPEGAMGTIGGVFYSDDAWPAVDTSHPVYVWDLDRELAPLMGTEHMTAEDHDDASSAEPQH